MRTAQKNVIHKKAASRKVSRLAARAQGDGLNAARERIFRFAAPSPACCANVATRHGRGRFSVIELHNNSSACRAHAKSHCEPDSGQRISAPKQNLDGWTTTFRTAAAATRCGPGISPWSQERFPQLMRRRPEFSTSRWISCERTARSQSSTGPGLSASAPCSTRPWQRLIQPRTAKWAAYIPSIGQVCVARDCLAIGHMRVYLRQQLEYSEQDLGLCLRFFRGARERAQEVSGVLGW